MIRKLLLTIAFLLSAAIANAQTISVIGDTSPSGNWTVDTNMTTTDNITYTLNNAVLTTATGLSTGLKFRQDGAWTTNWGGNTFPSGTGQLGGNNIQTIAGTYNITFNRTNGTYTFLPTGFTIIGMGGPAIDAINGYAGPDVDMVTTDGNIYTLSDFNFTSGNAYFRQNHDPTAVWGSTSFPSGVSVANGPPLFIPGGEWFVTFDRITKAYTFEYPRIGIIGSALPNGFAGPDTDLSSTDGFNYSVTNLVLTDGLVKFRKSDNWSVNWGGTDFPTGTGTQNGADIPVTAGTYTISFERTSGNYSFSQVLSINENAPIVLQISPNPTNNNWNLISNNRIDTIEIFDLVGKKISSVAPNSSEYSIEGNDFNSGVYFARITTSYGIKTIKLAKN